MKKTAVKWFVEKLPLIQQEGLRDEIEQAKEMEKEQIIEAHGAKQYHKTVSGEQYYNETFKNETK
jgi:hypothetical protein